MSSFLLLMHRRRYLDGTVVWQLADSAVAIRRSQAGWVLDDVPGEDPGARGDWSRQVGLFPSPRWASRQQALAVMSAFAEVQPLPGCRSAGELQRSGGRRLTAGGHLRIVRDGQVWRLVPETLHGRLACEKGPEGLMLRISSWPTLRDAVQGAQRFVARGGLDG